MCSKYSYIFFIICETPVQIHNNNISLRLIWHSHALIIIQLVEHFTSNGINLRFSCPHTSQHNGMSERMIRTIKNAIWSIIFQAQMFPFYWVEALHVPVHIINILVSPSISNKPPYSFLHAWLPKYVHLHVFGFLCF